ncbi:AAA family ATPase [Curtobacterium sp. CFBP9011]|uniref:AAA family ATPase n=1 Tax=Curtobacterium sp. CFBP9011 TaxID=3096530 RepID=UPI002A69C7E4|nr:ATP-binding protein [Curtobacterium sp. CFBP9011]
MPETDASARSETTGDGLKARIASARPLAARVRSASRTARNGRLIILVDGRSGTGKTTLGNALAAELDATLVHLDDIYPGWDGLQEAADAVVRDVLGVPAGYRRWDWARSEPADWVPVDASAPLVIEGCGALSRASAPLATFRVWLTADEGERRRRALDRDGEAFARQWERWARQEEAFIAAEAPQTLADEVLRSEEDYAQPSSCSRSSSMP